MLWLLKGNEPLRVPSQRPDQKGIHNRWHTVSVAFPATVAVATLLRKIFFFCRVASLKRAQESQLYKSKLAKYNTYVDDITGWKEFINIKIKPNSRCGKHK